MRAGEYKGWLPTLFVGQLLQGATVGIVGAGRIGAAYARMVRDTRRGVLLQQHPPQAHRGLASTSSDASYRYAHDMTDGGGSQVQPAVL